MISFNTKISNRDKCAEPALVLSHESLLETNASPIETKLSPIETDIKELIIRTNK